MRIDQLKKEAINRAVNSQRDINLKEGWEDDIIEHLCDSLYDVGCDIEDPDSVVFRSHGNDSYTLVVPVDVVKIHFPDPEKTNLKMAKHIGASKDPGGKVRPGIIVNYSLDNTEIIHAINTTFVATTLRLIYRHRKLTSYDSVYNALKEAGYEFTPEGDPKNAL